MKSGGYHCSVNDLRAYGNANDYSNTRPDDRNWNPAYGAAVDVSMSKADLIRAYGRVHAVWADHSDPRRKYFNAVNVWDGSGDATRLNFDKNTAGYADDSHKFHVHAELRRRYVLNAKAARAMVSMFNGDSKATWITREETTGLQGDDDMATITQADFNTRMDVWWNDRMNYNAKPLNPALVKLRVAPWQQEVGQTGKSTHDTLFGTMLTLLQQAAGGDVDPAVVAQMVIAGLDPQQIVTAVVAALPVDLAKQTADEIYARLAA